jgi:gamma-glutamylaminecyclotransferase
MADKAKHDDNGTIRVFVYGTLKQDHTNHVLLNSAVFLGYDSITGPYKLLSFGSIPGLVDTPIEDSNKIFGEVWSCDEETLAALDMFEGHPNLYRRAKLWSDRLSKRVWVYFAPPWWAKDAPGEVPSGMWKPKHEELMFWKKHEAA